MTFADFLNFKEEQAAEHDKTRRINLEIMEILKNCKTKLDAQLNLPEMPPAASTVEQLDELATSPNLVSMILLGKVHTFGRATLA